MPKSTKTVEIISPGQSRAARALLDYNQAELASKASLGLSTVVDFERSRRAVSDDAIQAIRAALEAAGVEFTNGGEPGVKLRKGESVAKPTWKPPPTWPRK
jgi:transcriptional regulator with XRE-family HTH domain